MRARGRKRNIEGDGDITVGSSALALIFLSQLNDEKRYFEKETRNEVL